LKAAVKRLRSLNMLAATVPNTKARYACQADVVRIPVVRPDLGAESSTPEG
jgi:hypothetical protein